MSRTSYKHHELIFGGKVKPLYYPGDDRKHTIMDLGKLNDIDRVELPELAYSQNLIE